MSLIRKVYKKSHPVPPSLPYLCCSCLHLLSPFSYSPIQSYLKAPDTTISQKLLLWLPKILTSLSQWPFSVFIPTSYLDTFFSYLPHAMLSWSLLDFLQPLHQGFSTSALASSCAIVSPWLSTLTILASLQFLKATMFPLSQGFAHTTHSPNIPHPILLS